MNARSTLVKKLMGLMMVCASASAFCQTTLTPAGLWKTFSDKEGQAESLVNIVEMDGEFQGYVTTIFSPPASTAHPLCDQCQGALKNKPIVGMKIMKGFRRTGHEFTGGEIFDPDEGKTYHGTMHLTEGGSKLEVRGYIGITLFGRTQTWLRQE